MAYVFLFPTDFSFTHFSDDDIIMNGLLSLCYLTPWLLFLIILRIFCSQRRFTQRRLLLIIAE
jgi:hypothetical protein